MGVVAATPAFVPRAEPCPPRYRPRNPRAISLYQLLDAHYETVKGLWEERFEQRYGFWRGFYDTAVARYLDCGLFEFARVKCTTCPNEFLVAFSCKGRGLCPSCGAKRAAIFSEMLRNQVLAEVHHVPKMLRTYFLHHRELARVLIHIPEPKRHLVHFYGAYANRVRQNFREPIRNRP